ncbi:MAG: DUF169 domain-containing protein [Oscillospiraceae bacterium]|nr:DUF169 domain-containing protein [Oscillospiraceae bacterium]MCL2126333.1 DUF169 domain-containing protein [Oscillospiraceae bacterium]
MNNMTNDFTPLKKLDLELPPIGVKFSFFKPDDVPPLEKDAKLSLCEMLKTAQAENRSFYFSKENDETCVGNILLGMDSFAGFEESGQIGPRLGVFDEARCNQHFYQFVPKLNKGIVNYVLFSPVEKLTYEPDVLVVAASPEKAEIVMRAMTYTTGEMYKSTCTPVMGCAWLLIHPYKTAEVNFLVPALVHGMHGRRLYSPDTLLIGIPYRWIPTILANLERMPLHLEGHKSKEAYYEEFGGIIADLSEKAKNP